MRFADYLQAHHAMPFQWGVHDCVLFAIGWLNIKTGRDYLAGLPKWSNRAEAHAVIKSVGGLEAALDRELKRIHPNMARDGDISMHKGICGLFSGANIVMINLDGGLSSINRMEAECAWSLP